MFETFEHIPAYPLVFPIFWGAFTLFLFVVVRRLRVFTAAHEGTPVGSSEVGIRAFGLVRYAFFQEKMFRWTRAGAVHYVVFLGSTTLLIGNANMSPVVPSRRSCHGRWEASCGPWRWPSRTSSP